MTNQDHDPVDRALHGFAAQRKRDLREVEQSGPHADQPDLRAAFLAQMGGERATTSDDRNKPEQAAPPAVEPPRHRGWPMMTQGFMAAALLLIASGVTWFGLTGPHGESAPRSPRVNQPGPAALGPTMASSSASAEGDDRIQVMGWEGNQLTLQLDDEPMEEGAYECYGVVIRANARVVMGPIEVRSSVQVFELPMAALTGEGPLEVTVRMLEGDLSGHEIGRWKAKVRKVTASDE